MNVQASEIDPQHLRPLLPLNWWGLFLRAIAATVILMAANMARSIPARWYSGVGEETRLAYNTAWFVLTPVLVFLAVWAWMRWVERAPLRLTGVAGGRRAVSGMLGGSALVACPMVVGWFVLAAVGGGLNSGPETPGGGETAVGVAVGVAYVLVRAYVLQGFPEELLYRGWLFSIVRDRPWVAFWFTTFSFMIIHLASAGGQQNVVERLVYLVLPLGMGMLAGAVVLWRGSMWWAVGTHGGMHLMLAVLTVAYPVELGTASWLVLGLAQVIMAAVILALWHRQPREQDREGFRVRAEDM
ncbi:CPBP family intramembrane glutamic endopeptidase [Corynebacterium doosanense]|nr:type II CAAX endopeptidase family protein [Corynebacterium doosanense]